MNTFSANTSTLSPFNISNQKRRANFTFLQTVSPQQISFFSKSNSSRVGLFSQGSPGANHLFINTRIPATFQPPPFLHQHCDIEHPPISNSHCRAQKLSHLNRIKSFIIIASPIHEPPHRNSQNSHARVPSELNNNVWDIEFPHKAEEGRTCRACRISGSRVRHPHSFALRCIANIPQA